MAENIHLRLDIRGALINAYRGALEAAGNTEREDALIYLDRDDGRPMGEVEAFRELLERLARGESYLPVGKCDGFSPQTGCPGHPTEEVAGG